MVKENRVDNVPMLKSPSYIPRKKISSLILSVGVCLAMANVTLAHNADQQSGFSFNVDNHTDLPVVVKLTNQTEKQVRPWGRAAFSRVLVGEDRSNWAVLDVHADGQECIMVGFELPYLLPKTEAVHFIISKNDQDLCVVTKE